MKTKTYTVHGFTGTLKEISDHFTISYKTLNTRLHLGWSLEKAISTPVDKLKSSKLSTSYTIGKVHGTYDTIEKRFGIKLNTYDLRSSEKIISKIRIYRKPEFYFVGKKYKGTLTAISEDFGCPISELKSGLKAGKTVGEILMHGGYFGEKK